MPIMIKLLFAVNAEEGEEEETLFNDCSLEVKLFSALILSEEDESATFVEEVLFLILVVSLVEVIISFLLEDISVEEQSDTWLKSSFVF